MASNITLSAASRSNLLSLQGTADLIGTTQKRLSTGRAVSSPIDNAVKFFQAKSLNGRASDLTERKDSIDQGVSALNAALTATDGIENLLNRMKSLIDTVRTQTASERKESHKQLGELVRQIDKLVEDATYKGLNLLNNTGASLTVRFSDKSDSKLEVKGIDLNAGAKLYRNSQGSAIALYTGSMTAKATAIANAAVSKLGLCKLSGYQFSKASVLATFQAKADVAIIKLEKTISNLRAQAATLATNADILKVRSEFTKEYVNVLKEGADKLVLADLNEEGANLLALQTRQQIGTQALSFAAQSEQSVMSLFR
jgi:flagellin-like hook-associated protein FlgL